MATGRPLKPVADAVARMTYQQMREGDRESARLHLESVKRRLLLTDPDYID